jgi:gamma-glutamyltranspeptidase/glutathione hydrolase
MRRRLGWFAFSSLVGAALLLLAQRREPERPARYASRGSRSAVAAGTEFAAQAGMQMFHKGGNAVDAGVAAMFAAAVVEFSHFGFGGEAPILIRTAEGRVHALAGVGPMPRLASAELFRQRRLQAGEIMTMEPGGIKGIIPVAGLMPALVPGMVEAGLVALREFGTLPLGTVMAPAIELADGFPLDEPRVSGIYHSRKFFELWPTSKEVFLPHGRIPALGEIFSQPNLARTLRAMVAVESQALKAGASRTAAIDAVRDYFYRGEIARKIDAFSRAHGGLLRYEDMAQFRLQPEAPQTTSYRGYQIYKTDFWGQGPSLLQALNILEGIELHIQQHNSAEYIHQAVEALKLAYADRDAYYGDPRMVSVPAARLLSKEYAAVRRQQIGVSASLEFRPGQIEGFRAMHPAFVELARAPIDDALAARDTTCVNAVDRSGVMFSATPSGAWLPSVIAGDTGIPLTQRAQSFLLIRGHPNELAPGKRPRVTLSPTLVTKEGRPYLALSTPGGDVQEQAILQLLLNIIDFQMDAQTAVEAPRFQTRHLVSSFDNHAMNPGDLLLDSRIPPSVYAELASRGHKTSTRSRWASGSAPVIIRVLPNRTLEAAADPYGYRVAMAW